jgi:hypothetical protein
VRVALGVESIAASATLPGLDEAVLGNGRLSG